MDCGYFEKIIYRLPDDDLTPAEREELAAHVAECDDCRTLYDAMAAARESLSEPVAVPEGFAARVMKGVHAEEKAMKAEAAANERRAKIKKHWRFGDLGLIAACLAMVVVVLNVVYGDLGRRDTGDSAAEAAPMMLEEAAIEPETAAATGAAPEAAEPMEAADMAAEATMDGGTENAAASMNKAAEDIPLPEGPEKQTDAAVEITPPPAAAQSADTTQLEGLLDAYKSIADDILSRADSDFGALYDCGCLADYDEDGWPEMVLLYSPDGMALSALIVRRDEYSSAPLRFEMQLWPALAGGANGAVCTGTLETGEHVLFLDATNWEGDTSVATSYVFSLEYSAILPIYTLEYSFDPDGALLRCHVMDGEGNTLSRDNEELFFNLYNARGSIETEFLSDDPGTRLTALFSADNMDTYRSLWG